MNRDTNGPSIYQPVKYGVIILSLIIIFVIIPITIILTVQKTKNRKQKQSAPINLINNPTNTPTIN